MLDPKIFQRIATCFYTPEADLFASRLNHQLPKYVTRFPDPGALATDAFLLVWNRWTIFIHPPIVLIPRILFQMKRDKATGLLIAPNWLGQHWFPDLMEMLVEYPARLLTLPSTISLPLHRKMHILYGEPSILWFGQFPVPSRNSWNSKRSVPNSHGIMAKIYTAKI